MKILRVICSPRGTSSESYRLSQTLINQLIDRHPGSDFMITERGVTGLAHIDADYAEAVSKRRDPTRPVAAKGALLQSEQLIRELENADCVVIATPMHNLMVPSALKAWLDHVVQADRTFRITAEGKVGTLRDRPVFIAIASGGTFTGVNAQQPDFLRPWLQAVLAGIGLLDVRFFSVEGTGQKPEVVDGIRAKTERETALYFAGHVPTPA
ncbi:NAD(P)H-dependent oxidoreductase [Pseudomonas sp. SWRI74]|uniref:FMN dependent NADH:quinone oxidoreductase n=1 Tax=Pseudomonas azerbaijanoccidentalis TaxID=2842347 RepID=A0ABS6QKJ1_9PSED|nr:NAD(P)H-dependent oxidoreductase [Pseudomonas azerbaijanoccidentalis]MBV4519454.1 NAD(P)H-dependent oxidoreductase [Pseudomonas azerbaijanoccidentalis]MCK8668956.1 NAD(P)H-dependent oxidoreductase [Pseudomonas azerbaijanoccidentalis]